MRNALWSLVKLSIVALVAYFIISSIPDMNSLPIADEPQIGTSSDTTKTAGATQAIFHTNRGDFTFELFSDAMPITTGNFIKLAGDGFYDNTRFHRVIAGFMIQGGDPLTKDATQTMRWGTGGPGYTIEDEFVEGYSNVRGTIAMANTGQKNSGGSQFFISVVDNTGLDFDKPPMGSSHPVFGKVISGMEIVDAIATTETATGDRPVEDVVITSVEIVR
ncbi:MAG: peptidylprolyl isomerase [Patescibacteria group bacterium]